MSKKRIAIYTFFGISVMLLILFIWQLDIFNWQQLDISKITNVKLSTRIYDSEGTEVSALSGTENRVYASLTELPEYVPLAFVAAEDARFFSHSGIDIRRIMGAALQNLRTASYSQGASTITQQLIKLTHLTSEKTLARKAQEACLAIQLEKVFTKDEILEAYLNTVYFGGGAYGIGAAARRYFDKDASELTLGEAALLAGIIKAPSAYAPHTDLQASLNRRNYVLDAMLREGYISQAEADAVRESVPEISAGGGTGGEYGWYMDAAANEATEILGISHEELLGGGYSIYTGLNTAMQSAAENAMASDEFYPEKAAQGALVAIAPGSGEIAAIVGGREYTTRLGLNRAVSARRQPGSLIKPLTTYAAAVDKHGYVPVSTVYDVQREYAGGYMPGNSGGNFYGEVTMRQALARSLNAATVDLADTVGIGEIIDYAESFGIPVADEDANLALALGAMTYGTTPVEMCAAYAALANRGLYNEPHFIRRITDRYGRTVYEFDGSTRKCISEQTAYILTDMLKTAASSGTARVISGIGIPVAAKTGTSGLDNGDTSDAWAAAYTPDIAVTVWIGKDSNSDGGMAKNVTGGGYAAPACEAFLSRCISALSGDDFVQPEGLTRLLIDGYALDNETRVLLASAATPAEYVRSEIFPAGTTLSTTDIWDTPLPVTDTALAGNKGETPVISFTGTGNYSEYLVIRNCRGESVVAGVVQCADGEIASFADTGADTSQINIYSIVPRHALLYSKGVTILGPESSKLQYEPGGLLNSVSSIFSDKNPTTDIESMTEPLF